MTTENLWDAAKAAPRGKLMTEQSSLKKQERHGLDSLTLHPKQLQTKEKPRNQQKEGNHKDPSRSKRKRNERNNNKDE